MIRYTKKFKGEQKIDIVYVNKNTSLKIINDFQKIV